MASTIRVLIVTLVFAGAAWIVYDRVSGRWHAAAIRELETRNAELQARIEMREAMLERLTRSRRVAHIEVTDQTFSLDGDVAETTIQFIELDDDGAELGRQEVEVPGRFVYVDAWTVRFDPGHVASGHPLYGRTLILFRRVYSERLAPESGVPLDVPGAVPPGYAVGDVGRFQKAIWEDFWELATDPALAATRHVRVAQGEAVYKPMSVGERYELIVEANGGMSLVPLDNEAATLSRVDE